MRIAGQKGMSDPTIFRDRHFCLFPSFYCHLSYYFQYLCLSKQSSQHSGRI